MKLSTRYHGLIVVAGLFGCLFGLNACATDTPFRQFNTTEKASVENKVKAQPPATFTPTPGEKIDRVYVPAISGAENLPVLAEKITPSPSAGIVVPQAISGSEVCSPLTSVTIEELAEVVSAVYAPPPPGKDDRHQGVDFSYWRRGERASILGDSVQAVLPGVVAGIVIDRYPYGNTIIIESRAEQLPEGVEETLGIQPGESVYVLYAHLGSPPTFQLGESVIGCQALDTVGKSGNAGVAHLHLEARLGPADSRFESMAFYIETASREERQAYILWRTSGVYRTVDPMLILTK